MVVLIWLFLVVIVFVRVVIDGFCMILKIDRFVLVFMDSMLWSFIVIREFILKFVNDFEGMILFFGIMKMFISFLVILFIIVFVVLLNVEVDVSLFVKLLDLDLLDIWLFFCFVFWYWSCEKCVFCCRGEFFVCFVGLVLMLSMRVFVRGVEIVELMVVRILFLCRFVKLCCWSVLMVLVDFCFFVRYFIDLIMFRLMEIVGRLCVIWCWVSVFWKVLLVE